MKTIRISAAQMQERIARFRDLKPLPIQNASIPEKARDVVYARKLLSGKAGEEDFRAGPSPTKSPHFLVFCALWS